MKYILKNGKEISIRRPVDENEEIFSLIKILSDESDNFPFTSEDFGLDSRNIGAFADYLNSRENSVFYIAEADSRIVGLGYLEGGKRARTAHCVNLGIGVLDEFSNKGIGNAILKELIRFASEGEYIAKIDLQVKSDNTKAIALYKKCGFVPEGKTSRALFIDGEFYDYLNMGLIID